MRMASIFLTLLTLFTIVSAQNVTREERDIHPKDKMLINEIRNRLNNLEKNLENRNCCDGSKEYRPKHIGAVYTRWGRTTCPGKDTELLYSGYAGGSSHVHKGAAVNHLCLPKDPEWNHYTNGNNGDNNYVFGAEYETNTKFSAFRGLHNYDVPCAVCRTKGRSSVYMIPAKTNCTKDWKMEYSGYLMAGQHDHPAATEYVCMDQDPEVIPRTSKDYNGVLFYLVEAQCGSLPCMPYVQGRELTCVICSK